VLEPLFVKQNVSVALRRRRDNRGCRVRQEPGAARGYDATGGGSISYLRSRT
jgi:hypothetical protein